MVIKYHTVTGWSKRCHSGFPKGRVEEYISRPGFAHPCNGQIHQWPSRWRCINEACKRVTRSRNATTRKRENKFIGNEIEWRYGDTIDQIPDELGIRWQKEWETTAYGSNDIIIMECIGVIMGILVPLLIIDRDHVCAIPEPWGNTLKDTMI